MTARTDVDDRRRAELEELTAGVGRALTTPAEVVTGDGFDELDDAALRERIAGVRVLARTNPERLRVVDAGKANGAIVAMTGDGVNDAPARRRADIGVAMGVIGTEVGTEAADMVLGDDDVAAIVPAVEERRRIYHRIRSFVRHLHTTDSGGTWVMFLAPLLGLPLLLASATAQLATVHVPALHDPFGTESPTAVQLAVVLAASTAAFVAVEIEDAIRRRREP